MQFTHNGYYRGSIPLNLILPPAQSISVGGRQGRGYIYRLTILLARLALFVFLGLLNWSTLALAIPSIVPFLIAQPKVGQGSFYIPPPAFAGWAVGGGTYKVRLKKRKNENENEND